MYYTTGKTAPWQYCEQPDARACRDMVLLISVDVDHHTSMDYFWHPSGKIFRREVYFVSEYEDDQVTWQVILPKE